MSKKEKLSLYRSSEWLLYLNGSHKYIVNSHLLHLNTNGMGCLPKSGKIYSRASLRKILPSGRIWHEWLRVLWKNTGERTVVIWNTCFRIKTSDYINLILLSHKTLPKYCKAPSGHQINLLATAMQRFTVVQSKTFKPLPVQLVWQIYLPSSAQMS